MSDGDEWSPCRPDGVIPVASDAGLGIVDEERQSVLLGELSDVRIGCSSTNYCSSSLGLLAD